MRSSQRRSPSSRRAIGPFAVLTALVASISVWVAAAPTLDGKTIFRFDTFGDEQLWNDTLGLHEVIQDAVSPIAALGVG